jgi:hypothetical protein
MGIRERGKNDSRTKKTPGLHPRRCDNRRR